MRGAWRDFDLDTGSAVAPQPAPGELQVPGGECFYPIGTEHPDEVEGIYTRAQLPTQALPYSTPSSAWEGLAFRARYFIARNSTLLGLTRFVRGTTRDWPVAPNLAARRNIGRPANLATRMKRFRPLWPSGRVTRWPTGTPRPPSYG